MYIFGLNRDKKTGELSTEDRTGKAKKSHKAFVEKNLEFIEDLKSPIIDAYRQFLLNWNPEEELENKFLLGLGKDYETSGFSFALSGKSDTTLLYEDIELKKKWDAVCKTNREMENRKNICTVCHYRRRRTDSKNTWENKGSIWWPGNRKRVDWIQ